MHVYCTAGIPRKNDGDCAIFDNHRAAEGTGFGHISIHVLR